MKKVLLGLIACTLSVSAFSAQMMTQKDFDKVKDQYVEVGNVSTSGETSASDAKAELSSKADKLGGEIYVLTAGNTNNKIHGNATVYKKK